MDITQLWSKEWLLCDDNTVYAKHNPDFTSWCILFYNKLPSSSYPEESEHFNKYLNYQKASNSWFTKKITPNAMHKTDTATDALINNR